MFRIFGINLESQDTQRFGKLSSDEYYATTKHNHLG